MKGTENKTRVTRAFLQPPPATTAKARSFCAPPSVRPSFLVTRRKLSPLAPFAECIHVDDDDGCCRSRSHAGGAAAVTDGRVRLLHLLLLEATA